MRTAATLLVLFALALAQKLVFFDDFDELDNSVWSHEITLGGGGNWEFEWYTNNRSNSYVRDSVLYLQPTLSVEQFGTQGLQTMDLNIWGSTPADLCTGNAFYGCERIGGAGGNIINPVQSASIRTTESFSFKFGRMEIRAKLPKGNWIWPAMWLLPRYNSYGQWPASGEIDVVESRGNDASYPDGGINQFGSTLHWGPNWQTDAWVKTHATKTLSSGDFNDDFHVFGLYWDNTTLYTYLDDESQIVLKVAFDTPFWQKGGWDSAWNNPWAGRGNAAPFDQKYYLIFNVAVGGTTGYFPDGVGGKPWNNADTHASNTFWANVNEWYPTWKGEDSALQVDWVKIWQ